MKEAIFYSITNGGKKLRPVLLLEASRLVNLEKSKALLISTAIECIHSYSLVHDDLPAMDNDDFRRGKPANHKAFGEDVAILVGDALQSLAFELLLMAELPINCILYFLKNIGPQGMVGGQFLDIKSSSHNKISYLEKTHYLKTGKLIQSCITLPFLICNYSKSIIKEIENWGADLGKLFQIIDDILDFTGNIEKLGKSPNKDKEKNKLTYIEAYGLEKSKKKAKEISKKLVLKAKKIFPNSELLQQLPIYIFERQS